jgi:hypothetical protein
MRAFAGSVVALVLLLGAGLARAEGIEPVEGPYKGKTAQNQLVYFGFREGAVVNPRFTVKWGHCGTAMQHDPRGRGELDAAGHFAIDQGQTAIEGTFVAPNVVEGIALFREHPLAGCPERAIPFKAHLRVRR